MKENRADAIKNEFLKIYDAIKDLTNDEILNHNDDAFRPWFEKLHPLVAMDVDDQEVEEIIRDKKIRQVIKHVSHLKKIYGLRMEIESARTIINGPDSWALLRRFEFYPNYAELARMEYQGANLEEGNRVVFLGSGPLPLSLISLCKQYDVKGVGIEHEPEYVELSKKLIKALELSRFIHIVHGNHFDLPLNQEFQLVMVGADACPKNEIFTHLAKALPDGTKISYRIYEKGLRRLIDDQSLSQLPSEFKEYSRIRPEPPVNNTAVFLIKDTGSRSRLEA